MLFLHVFCQCLRFARHDAFRDCEFKRMPNLTACDVYIQIFAAIAAHCPFAACVSAAVHVSFHNPVLFLLSKVLSRQLLLFSKSTWPSADLRLYVETAIPNFNTGLNCDSHALIEKMVARVRNTFYL